ncbi:MAG: outer membrane protein [bacterium]|nr:MAG: outer membrane protein [bacterium]KAF0147608.1 MAG: outer membrane protein [bacterium]KAF0168901.1 MAG: outer membrane protein [bacterium]TXT18048.1 MAG: outer membrane protein [bacterium]
MKSALSLATIAVLLLPGCATKDYVHEYVQSQMKPVSGQVAAVEGRTGTLEGRVGKAESGIQGNAGAIAETNRRVDGLAADMQGVQGTLKDHTDRLVRNEAEVENLSRAAREAMDRATAAGKLAQGKLVHEVVLSDETLKFGSDKARLGKDAEAALDAFAAKLKGENRNVFIEIQGHTDSRGDATLNLKLGEARAEAVRRHLNMKGGIPLHRMSVISYGESAPVADNKLKAGRQQNRRVVLVVLQ